MKITRYNGVMVIRCCGYEVYVKNTKRQALSFVERIGHSKYKRFGWFIVKAVKDIK